MLRVCDCIGTRTRRLVILLAISSVEIGNLKFYIFRVVTLKRKRSVKQATPAIRTCVLF